MGIASYFRWLSTKYPKIVSPVIEQQPEEINGEAIPLDISKPNPNGEETDNLYLDMNNIVHPCTHPDGRPAPDTEEEMLVEVFKYADRIVNMARPRKLLMMAVDGVAPRAKMNQQRSRRFRAAQDAREEEANKQDFHKKLIELGQAAPGSKPATEKRWDSNAITPGTPFMHKLADALRYWTAYKLNTDPGWAKLKVIISDASIPGEGEHKIMEFIRSQRRSPEHNPNTRHVIYGLDADLIMLGLATHEPHFRILREDVFFQEAKAPRCDLCGQKGHAAPECTGAAKEKQGEFDEKEKAVLKPYIWLHVHVLREYLEVEMQLPQHPFKWDLERAIDDYVFLCFFVGNDFLPHLPSLEIREEGVDTLIQIWKENLPLMGGYVTKDGSVDLAKAQYILDALASREAAIFKRRREVEVRRQQRQSYRENGRDNGRNSQRSGQQNTSANAKKRKIEDPNDMILFTPGAANTRQVRELAQQAFVDRKELFRAQVENANTANKSAAAVIKEQLLKRKASLAEPSTPAPTPDETASEQAQSTPPSALGKRKVDLLIADDDTDSVTPGRTTPVSHGNGQPNSTDMPVNDVKLWEEGYEERYYERKFRVDPKDLDFRHKVAESYVEGLCWVLLYYMQGCPSWQWFYPHHYAPFAADFTGMAKMKPKFDNGKPFKPYEQLMGVFPADSGHAIPGPYRSLMTEEDSPILDFYPEDFEIDLNGKKFKWQGVALLPFIDQKRLLGAMATRTHLLSEDEVSRNQLGRDVLFFSQNHPMYDSILMDFYSKKQEAKDMSLDVKLSEGLTGKVERIESYLPNGPLDFPLAGELMPTLPVDNSMSVYFDITPPTHVHKSQLLRGVVHPARKLDSHDIDLTRHRSKRGGRSYGGVPLDRRRPNGPNGPNGHRRQSGEGAQQPPPINYANPFAAHINFNGMPPGAHGAIPPIPPFVNGVPPPPPGWPLAGQGGFPGPPPQQFNTNNSYQNSQGQNGRGRGGYQNFQQDYNTHQNNHNGYNHNHNGYDNQPDSRNYDNRRDNRGFDSRRGDRGYDGRRDDHGRGGMQNRRAGGYERDSRNNPYGRR